MLSVYGGYGYCLVALSRCILDSGAIFGSFLLFPAWKSSIIIFFWAFCGFLSVVILCHLLIR